MILITFNRVLTTPALNINIKQVFEFRQGKKTRQNLAGLKGLYFVVTFAFGQKNHSDDGGNQQNPEETLNKDPGNEGQG